MQVFIVACVAILLGQRVGHGHELEVSPDMFALRGDPDATAFFQHAHVLEQRKDLVGLRRHLTEYLQRWGTSGGLDRAIAAEVRLGQLSWQSACPVAALDGLCVTSEPLSSAGATQHCDPPPNWQVPRFKLVPRRPSLVEEAMQHVEKALELYQSGGTEQKLPVHGGPAHTERVRALRDHAAVALLLQGDRDYERMIAAVRPTEMCFDPHRAKALRESTKRFKAWIVRETELLLAAQKKYQSAMDLKSPESAAFAAARIGGLFQSFSDKLFLAEIPRPPDAPEGSSDKEWASLFRNAFCDQMQDQAAPLRMKAKEFFERCLKIGRQLNANAPIPHRCVQSLIQMGVPVDLKSLDGSRN